MGYPARWTTVAGGSGTLDTVVVGTTTGGTAISTSDMQMGTVSCLFVVEAETDTVTITGKFQVSDDNSTWYDLAGDAQNPANVVMATGTGGADAVISRVLPMPSAAMGWKYVRAATVIAGATGAAIDTYAFTWKYRKFSGFQSAL
jgi:hypothetical protein